MTPPNSRTIGYSIILLGLAIILTIPDVIFGLLLDLFHTLWELLLHLLHLLFEAIESGLDHLIEDLFHTDTRATQLIVFYVLVVIGCGFIYGLVKLLIPLFRRYKNYCVSIWREERAAISRHWFKLSLFDKLKALVIIGCLVYLFFLVSF
jgi:hypothetical protein